MAAAQRTEIFDVDIHKLYAVITDYQSYPDFVEGVSGTQILEQDDDGARVEYSLNMIKKFKYILQLEHRAPTNIKWHLESGDLFKSNEGSWELEDLGSEGTKVTYTLEVNFKGFAPKMVVNKLVANNLPAMMQSYYQRAKSL